MEILLSTLLAMGLALPQIGSGTISGQIMDVDGNPAVAVRVRAIATSDGEDAGPGVEPTVSVDWTDEAGRYQLEDVPPGRYWVLAGPARLPTFYPGTRAGADALAVVLTEGSVSNTVDFPLALRLGFEVRGRLLRDSAADSQFQSVLLSGEGQTLRAQVRADQSFRFFEVPPGTYRLSVGVTTLNLPTIEIVVVDRDVLEVEMAAPVFAEIDGRIEVAGGGPVPLVSVLFGSADRNYRSFTRPDGTFSLTLPEGEYQLPAVWPGTYELRSIFLDTTELADSILTVNGSRRHEIVIRLGPASADAWHTVGGRVVADDIEFTAQSVVLTRSSYQLMDTSLGADGTFEFTNVPPGPYVLRVPPGPTFADRRILVDGDVLDLEIHRSRLVEVIGGVHTDGDLELPRVSVSFAGENGQSVANLIRWHLQAISG